MPINAHRQPPQHIGLPPRRPAVAVLCFVLIGCLLAAALPAADAPPLTGLDGNELREGDLLRGRTLVVVWAPWSPRCRDIVARVNRLVARWSSEARVVTVVFQDSADAARDFLEGQRLQAPTYLDTSGAFAKKHAVTTLPGLLIFSAGELQHSGELPADPDPIIERELG